MQTKKSTNKNIKKVATYAFLFMTLTKEQILKGLVPITEEKKPQLPAQDEILTREKLRTRIEESKHKHLRVFEEQNRPDKAAKHSTHQSRHSFRHR